MIVEALQSIQGMLSSSEIIDVVERVVIHQ